MSEHAPHAVRNHLAGSLTGTIAGRFEIGERLGKGAMGEVYRAHDKRLKRSVALKRLSPSLRSDPLYRKRFQQEAERASAFSDAHAASVYDVIENEDELFLVMELVEGQTLRQRLQTIVPVNEFLNIGIECAEALEAAHRCGLVHCDIKPENIMLSTSGQVKILDFGVAKHLPRSDQSSTIDRSGASGGTPAYMSPEVLLERTPDHRADLFSLGVVLYEGLAGHHPFASASYVQTAHRILHEQATSLRVLNPKIPEELERIVTQAMAKDPAQRYTDARDLADDLRSVQSGITPSRLLPARHVEKVRGSRWQWWAAAAAAVALVALVLVAFQWEAIRHWWGPAPPVTQMQLAILPFTPAGNDANSQAFAEGLTESIAMRLVQLTNTYPLQIVPPRDLAADAIHTAQQARRTYGVNLVLEGDLRQFNNMVRVSYSLVDAAKLTQLRGDTITVEANKPFDVEDRVLQSIVGQLGLQLQPGERASLLTHGTQQPAAYDYYLRGRGYLQEYLKPENLESAITAFRHALETDPKYALAYAGLGEAYLDKYEQDRQQKWMEQALQNCQQAVSFASELATGHICLGMVYNRTGQYENAVKEFQVALQRDPLNDDGYRGLAHAYQLLGKMGEAEQTFQKAIQLRPQYWGGYNWLGSFYYNAARYDDAARMFTQMIALAPDSFRGYSNLGGVYLTQGHYPDAITQFGRSVSIYPSGGAYSNLASAYFFEGNYTQAAGTYEKAVQVGGNEIIAYQAWRNLGEAYYWIPDQRTRSRDALEKAVALAKERLAVNARDVDAMYEIAVCYAMLQQNGPALDFLKRALKTASDDPELLFTAGKVYVLLGKPEQGLSFLTKAVNAQYSKFVIRDDPAFKSLASNVQFQRLVGSVK
jgi:tetratricopeptide (TPR) repeat protein/tRNA A-37 threonylcarbamoyl transferase component Bud32